MKIIRTFEKTSVVFHFNKKCNENPDVPMWILKVNGETFYVHHVEISSGVGFSTKETPENSHTKGAIKIKGVLNIFENSVGLIEGVIS